MMDDEAKELWLYEQKYLHNNDIYDNGTKNEQ